MYGHLHCELATKSNSETSGQSFNPCQGTFPLLLRKSNHNLICEENCLPLGDNSI